MLEVNFSKRQHNKLERLRQEQTAWWTKKTSLTMRANHHRNQARLVQIRCLLEHRHRRRVELIRLLQRLSFQAQIIVIITRGNPAKSAWRISLFLKVDVQLPLVLEKTAPQATSIWALRAALISRLVQHRAPVLSLMSATKCQGTWTERQTHHRQEIPINNNIIHKSVSRRA